MVHDGQGIVGLDHVHLGDRPPRATHEIQVPPLAVHQPGHPGQFGLGDGPRLGHVPPGPFREADDPERQAGGIADPSVPEVHHLQRAAADIAQDAVGLGEAQQHALGGKGRLALPAQHGDRHARHALAQRGGEGWAVLGIAHRRGGQDLQRIGRHGPGHGMVALQHGQRLFHRRLVQAPRGLQAPPQSQHRLLVEDRHRVAAPPLEDHQSHGVRAQIHHATAGRMRDGFGWKGLSGCVHR